MRTSRSYHPSPAGRAEGVRGRQPTASKIAAITLSGRHGISLFQEISMRTSRSCHPSPAGRGEGVRGRQPTASKIAAITLSG